MSCQDYGTPAVFIRAVEERFSIRLTVDLAAHEGNAKCERWVGEEEDSLTVDWDEVSGQNTDREDYRWLPTLSRST